MTFSNTQYLKPYFLAHLVDLAAYSTRPHGVALWRLDRENGKFIKILTLPGCGDTAFPSIVRVSENKFLVANYSSPFPRCEGWSWIRGQLSPKGTGIYFIYIDFFDNKNT